MLLFKVDFNWRLCHNNGENIHNSTKELKAQRKPIYLSIIFFIFILTFIILPILSYFFFISYFLFIFLFPFLLFMFVFFVLVNYRKKSSFLRKIRGEIKKIRISNKELKIILIIFSITISFTFTFTISVIGSTLFKNMGWIRNWGGQNKDLGRGIAIDSNDNIYITGVTLNYGEDGLFLIKYDIFGTILWNKTWGIEGSESGYRIAIDSSDNIYVLGGTMNNSDLNYDIVLIKFNSEGKLIWNRSWDGAKDDHGTSIAIDSQNNIYIGGTIDGEILLLKYDNSGTYLWNVTWGTNETDWCFGLGVDSEDSIYIGGSVQGNGFITSSEILLLKYNGAGNLIWNTTWGDLSQIWCMGLAIDTSDNIFLLGERYNDVTLLQFDKNGKLNWYKTWSGVNGYDMKISRNNNIFIGGWAHNPLTWSDFLFIKVNNYGELESYGTWFKDSYELGRGIAIDSNENVYIVGLADNSNMGTGDDIFLIKNPFFSVDVKLCSFILMELFLVGILIFYMTRMIKGSKKIMELFLNGKIK